MGYQIEDCSTYTALILILSWYAYAIFGSVVILEDLGGDHCYVHGGDYQPVVQIPDGDNPGEYEDAASSSRYICIFGIGMFSLQLLLLCLSGLHKIIAYTAASTFVGWAWYFIDMHRIRYSHLGKVCFGDYL